MDLYYYIIKAYEWLWMLEIAPELVVDDSGIADPWKFIGTSTAQVDVARFGLVLGRADAQFIAWTAGRSLLQSSQIIHRLSLLRDGNITE